MWNVDISPPWARCESGVGAHCWGSEGSGVVPGLSADPASFRPHGVWVVGGVGLLFEIWIVDASIL